MPLTFRVDPASGRLFTVAVGKVTLEDVRTHVLHEREEGHLEREEIIDGTGAEPAFTPADVRTIVTMLRALAESTRLGPTAVLVASDYAFGMVRMIEILLGDVARVRPFRELAEAEAWLAAPTV